MEKARRPARSVQTEASRRTYPHHAPISHWKIEGPALGAWTLRHGLRHGHSGQNALPQRRRLHLWSRGLRYEGRDCTSALLSGGAAKFWRCAIKNDRIPVDL